MLDNFQSSHKKINSASNISNFSTPSKSIITPEQKLYSNNSTNSRIVIEEILDFDSFFKEPSREATNEPSKGYSANNYSDIDNIYINKLSDVMTDLQNNLGPEYYKVFSSYITGLKLSDIIASDGTIIPLKDTDKLLKILQEQGLTKDPVIVMSEINKILSEGKINFGETSAEMLSSTITEVVQSNHDYDAMVLKNSEGNYLIVNSCTNASSTNDIYAIAYVMAKQIVGDNDLLDLAIEQIIPAINNSAINDNSLYLDLINNGGTKYLEEVYNSQLQSNIDLIEKYTKLAEKEGQKVELNGFSLGGGLQLTAYSMACMENPEIENYIQSVSVFNPYISYLEQNPMNQGTETKNFFERLKQIINQEDTQDNPLVSYVASSEKVRIYSSEEDYISTFNNSVYDLLDRFTFIKTKDLEKGKVKELTDIFKVVIGDEANHGFKPIIGSSFDEYGNIAEPGSYVSISDSLENVIDDSSPLKELFRTIKEKLPLADNEEKYKVDYSSIILQTMNLANIDQLTADIPELKPILNKVSKYLRTNIGNYSYDGLVEAATDGVWDVVGVTITTEVPKMISSYIPEGVPDGIKQEICNIAVDIAHTYKDEKAFKDALNGFLTSPENKDYVLSLLTNINSGDYLKAYGNINTLMSNFNESFEIEYENVGKESIKIFGFEVEYTNVISEFINDTIKTKVTSLLEETVSSKIRTIIKETMSDVDIKDLPNIVDNFFKGE